MLQHTIEFENTSPVIQVHDPIHVATRTIPPLWEWFALGTITLLAFALDFVNLEQDGYPNTYYATAVKSMLLSWHNFYFVAFDPGGFVSIDKPPIAFWLQTVSAKIFGFNGVSLVLPQALAGVIAVVVLYHLVRRTFGGPAALTAALALTLSPINVVANRDNTVDSLLVLTSLLAAWAMLKATENNSLGWLLLSGALIGLGFNIKMLEAFLVVPALVLLFLLGSSLSWWKRTGFLLLMLGVMLAVSLSWALSIDLTPANARPYVGSSQTNSEIELAFGYNGIERILDTHAARPTGTRKPHTTPTLTRPALIAIAPLSARTGASTTATAPTKANAANTPNDPGPLRLLQPYLGGQIGWLLPLALLGLLASAWNLHPRAIIRSWGGKHLDRQAQGFILWGVWCVTQGIVFSYAHAFSPYYMVMLMLAIAALTGIGLVAMWRDYHQQHGWRRWLLPIAIIVTGIEQYIILAPVTQWDPWLGATSLSLALALGIVLIGIQIFRRFAQRGVRSFPETIAPDTTSITPATLPRHTGWVLIPLALVVIMLAPTLWTFSSFNSADVGSHPISGPRKAGVARIPLADPRLVLYLTTHQAGARFLAATVTADVATPIIFSTDAPVMAMGGFNGSNPILMVTDLANLVNAGAVRNFLLPASNLTSAQVKQLYPAVKTPPKTHYTNSLTRWVSTTCSPVPPREWSTAYSTRKVGSLALFACGGSDLPPV